MPFSKGLWLMAFALFVFCKYPAQNGKAEEDLDRLLTPLSDAIEKQDSLSFQKHFRQFYRQAKTENNMRLLVGVLNKCGIYSYYKGDWKGGIRYYDTAIAIASRHSLDHSLTGFYMNRGAIYYSDQKYAAALKDYKQSEALMLKLKSEKIGGLLGNISLLYREIGDLENAKKYLQRALPFIKALKDTSGYAKSINNLGLIYKDEKNYEAADSIFKIGYDYSRKNQMKHDFADVTYNLVINLGKLSRPAEALPYSLELLEHVRKHKDASWEKLVLQQIAETYFLLNKPTEAKKYLRLSENILVETVSSDRDTKTSLLSLAQLYYYLADFKNSANAYKAYFKLEENNTVSSELNNVTQLTYSYERRADSLRNAQEKQIAEIETLRLQEKTEHRLQQQRVMLVLAGIILVAIIVFAFIQVKAKRAMKRANTEITEQKKLITEKNKEITDSIQYARHIQQSLLPRIHELQGILPNYFLIYLPKDIVSGDFYWAKKLSNDESLIAVADCTGHGVPGAVMSALSIQQLNEIAEKYQSPSEILRQLNLKIIRSLQQNTEGESKDGLDIVLCQINHKTRKVIYAGANRNLWVFDSNGFKAELKATKAGIAGHTAAEQVFEEQMFEAHEHDVFILSTDGYADQFGGEHQKKITTRQFKKFVADCDHGNLSETGNYLKEKYLNWKADSEQIDDVCVIGFKLS
jgi:serine phosphatase RsbU (regulator of sigma subunit)/tetratricopeptide (TPR) repeat protein